MTSSLIEYNAYMEQNNFNKETIKALKEAERIARDPNVKHYSDVEEALKELKKQKRLRNCSLTFNWVCQVNCVSFLKIVIQLVQRLPNLKKQPALQKLSREWTFLVIPSEKDRAYS